MLGQWTEGSRLSEINALNLNNVCSANFLFADNIVFQGEDDHAGGILDVHFFQYPRPVAFNGALAEEEQLADLLGGMLAADKPDDVFFPVGEQGGRRLFL